MDPPTAPPHRLRVGPVWGHATTLEKDLGQKAREAGDTGLRWDPVGVQGAAHESSASTRQVAGVGGGCLQRGRCLSFRPPDPRRFRVAAGWTLRPEELVQHPLDSSAGSLELSRLFPRLVILGFSPGLCWPRAPVAGLQVRRWGRSLGRKTSVYGASLHGDLPFCSCQFGGGSIGKRGGRFFLHPRGLRR